MQTSKSLFFSPIALIHNSVCVRACVLCVCAQAFMCVCLRVECVCVCVHALACTCACVLYVLNFENMCI